MARANTKPGARPPQGARPAGGAAPAGAVTPSPQAPAPTPELTPPATEGTRPDAAAPGEPIAGFAAPADDAVDIHAMQPSDALRIVAVPPEGFRRCGRWWSGTEPTIVHVAELTDDQVERLLTEPQLSVSVITQAEE